MTSTHSSPRKLSVVVFAYNESANVVPVLEDLVVWLSTQPYGSEVIFVDDGSGDDTLAQAEEALKALPENVDARVISHPANRGIGAAIKTGVDVAQAGYVTFLPCDGQIPPSALATMVEAADAESADLVLTLYHARRDGTVRKVLSWGVRTLIWLVHGVAVESEGPYLFRRGLFLPSQLPPDSFFLNFEFPIRASAAGLRISTVRIPCLPRRSGHSKALAGKRIRAVSQELLGLRLRRLRSAVERAVGREF